MVGLEHCPNSVREDRFRTKHHHAERLVQDRLFLLVETVLRRRSIGLFRHQTGYEQINKKREIVVTTGDSSRDQLWLDQYLPADLFQCRLFRRFGDQSTGHRFASTNAPAKAQCHLCTNSTTHEEVTEKEFRDYLPFFLHDNRNLKCPKGGHATHGSSVKLYEHNGMEETSVIMSYHSLLISSADFIDAMQHAYRLMDNITATSRKAGHDVEVFPYR